MALPVLNETPRYELTVPSTNKKIKFRPYLVKEEKVLLIASETNDRDSIVNAIIDTVMACVHGEVHRDELTMFDLEYMFVMIRSKSVGERVDVQYPCQDCNHINTVELNLENVVCEIPSKENKIDISDGVTIEMMYPGYSSFDINLEDETELGFSIIANSIKSVLTEEEKIDVSDEPKEEIYKFIESMTTDQFRKIADFVRKMPALKYESSFICQGCGKNNDYQIRGLKSFF